MTLIEIVNNLINNKKLAKIIMAAPVEKKGVKKIEINPFLQKNELFFQMSYIEENKGIHKNYSSSEIVEEVLNKIQYFKQINIFSDIEEYQVLRSSKGKEKIIKKVTEKKDIIFKEHNKQKEYIISDGEMCDFLIYLGVMDKSGKVIQKKYDKFRQINRYLEFIRDIIKEFPNDKKLKIVDFGSGKAYLTFALYYYLVKHLKLEVEIYGVDLKKDVIEFCNKTAEDLLYTNLKFVYGDIKSFDILKNADFVVTLHACDTATDDAIVQALKWNAKVIMCVPCCQHELFDKIENSSMKPLLKHGIIKEKLSSLITDSLRGNILEIMGYNVQILEFIDMEHTPKNILIRAVKKNSLKNLKAVNEYNELKKLWNIEPYIEKALEEELDIKIEKTIF